MQQLARQLHKRFNCYITVQKQSCCPEGLYDKDRRFAIWVSCRNKWYDGQTIAVALSKLDQDNPK
jgi:hypothetical protein